MRKLSLLLALVAGLFATPAFADFTAKDASAATITFKNPGVCTSVVCVPVVQLYDGTNVVTLSTAGADAVSNTLTGVPVYARNLVFNGTTWDRWQGAVTISSGTVTTVSTVTNLSQMGGAAIAMGTGVRSAGTQRVTIATDDVVPASQSGTWNINNVAGTVSLPTGAATAAKQPALGTAGAASADVLTVQGIASMTPFLANPGTAANWGLGATAAAVPATAHYVGMAQGGNLIGLTGTSGNLNVQCANCSGSGVSTVDAATFTASTSLFAGTGGFFQTTATSNPLTNGQQGMWQMTANRAGFVNLRDTAGVAIGTSAAEVFVGGRGTAGSAGGGVLTVQGVASMTPILATITGSLTANQSVNVAQINGVTALMGNGPTGTGSQRVTIASDNTAFAVTAASTLAAETTKVIGTTRTVGNVGGVMDAIGQNVAAPANWLQMGCQFQTSPTTITAANGSPCQMDNAGNLKVNIAAGASSGAVAQGSTTSGQTGGLVQGAVTTAAPTYTTAQTNPLSLTTAGALRTADATAQGSLATIATNSGLPLPTQAITVPIGGSGIIDTNSKTMLLDPCQYTQHVWTRIDVAAAASTVLVAGTSAKKTYICSIGLMAAGTTNLGIVEGSGTTCGTSPLGLIGGNTAAKGLNLTAQAGASFGNGQYAIAASTVNANDVCLINSAAIQVSGFIVTATP